MEEAYADKNNTFVSSLTPLLSNLSMLENISLVLQVHERIGRKQAHQKALDALSLLGLDNLAILRYEACSNKEIFLVQLIRACIQKDVKIIIEQPFMLLSDAIDLNNILGSLDKLGIAHERVLIIDLKHQEKFYEESGCRIIG